MRMRPAVVHRHRPTTGVRRADTHVVWYLRYDDDYVRTGCDWLIERRALTIGAIETRLTRRLR